ncbi:MAG: hypothetical protein MJ252_30900 [archaeon]|nr:hypothetical protein [archaeon]
MYANNQQGAGLNEVYQCSYSYNRDFVLAAIKIIINYPKNTIPKYKKIPFGSDLLIQVTTTLPIMFQSRNYDIPIQIIFPKNFPQEKPMFFLEVQPGTGINTTNKDINPANKAISSPTLNNWTQNNTLYPVLDEIKESFTKIFPCYKLKAGQGNQSQRMGGMGGLQRSMTYQQNQPGGSTMYTFNQGIGQGTNIYGQPQQPSVYKTQNYYNNQMGMGNNTGYSQINRGQGMNMMYGNQSSNIYGNQGSNVYNIPNVNSQKNNPSQGYQSKAAYSQGNNFNNMNSKEPQEQMKEELISILKAKLEPRIKDENNKNTKQNVVLNNYKKNFTSEIEKMNNVLNNKDQIEQRLNGEVNNLTQQYSNIANTINYNANQGGINSENAMNYVNGSDMDYKLIDLVAREAYYEDMINAIKKAFSKGAIDISDATKNMRMISRELLAVKYKRRKMGK